MVINSKQKHGKAPQNAGVFVDLRSDFGFKKIFGEEAGKKDLIRMLNAFIDGALPPEIPPIEDIEHIDREQIGATKHQRKAVYDLYLRDQKNRFYIVEMQNQRIKFAVNRLYTYISKAVSAMLKKGPSEDFDLDPAIGIIIANFIIAENTGPEVVNLIHYHCIKPNMPTPPTPLLTVELPKFNKTIDQLKTEKDVYLFLLNNLASLEAIPPKLDTEKYRPLFERARIANFNKKEMTNYERSRKHEETKRLEMKCAREEGIEKGRMEEKIQTVQTLLSTTALGADRIAEILCLPLQQVEKIRQGQYSSANGVLTSA